MQCLLLEYHGNGTCHLYFLPIHTRLKAGMNTELENGFITTDVYSKATDSHIYLPFDSSHPAHWKRAVPYGVALRLHRNCSSPETRDERALEYKSYLRRQGYPSRLIEGKFSKAFNLERKELLKPNSNQQKKNSSISPRL